MRYTLLQLTQDILSSMDSDEVNSISDTVESMQVVKVIKTVYDDIVSRTDLTKNDIPCNLVAWTDNTKPTLMTKPIGIDRIKWIRYNKIALNETEANWDDIVYLPFENFLEKVQGFGTDASDVGSFQHTVRGYTFTINYLNDTAPTYYSTFDDDTIVFDSYDSAVDTTLQSIKTVALGTLATEWEETDSYVPNLQPEQFALLLNEAKSVAWGELKQQSHPKAEQAARRNWRHIQKVRSQIPDPRFDNKAHNFYKFPSFGRK